MKVSKKKERDQCTEETKALSKENKVKMKEINVVVSRHAGL